MAVSTALFAVATGASRLVGMLREAATAWIFTVQGESINAFTVAYQIPNLIRSLVADAALGAAFVPIFNELLTKGERDRAWRVASTVWWLSFAGLSAVTAIAMVLAPQMVVSLQCWCRKFRRLGGAVHRCWRRPRRGPATRRRCRRGLWCRPGW